MNSNLINRTDEKYCYQLYNLQTSETIKNTFYIHLINGKKFKMQNKRAEITYVYFSMKPVFSLDFVLVFMKVGGSTNYIIILKNW